jgi:hypothetical protein
MLDGDCFAGEFEGIDISVSPLESMGDTIVYELSVKYPSGYIAWGKYSKSHDGVVIATPYGGKVSVRCADSFDAWRVILLEGVEAITWSIGLTA